MKGLIKRILLISQEKGYDSKLVKLLQSQNDGEFEVNQAYPIEKALGELNNVPYDLVILDLPVGIDCTSIAEKICMVNGQLPIIILSQFGNEFTAHAIRRGAQQVINKTSLNTFQLSQDILAAIDRKKIENEIRMRDKILQAVNHAAELFLTQSDWNVHLSDVLTDLGLATKSDRVYIFKNTKNGNGSVRAELCEEWVDEGVQVYKTASIGNGVFYEKLGFKRWVNTMEQGQIIHGDVENLPGKEQAFLMKLGVKTFVYVPIFSNQSWWGFIGFDQCTYRAEWSRVEIDALRTAANIIGAAIARQVSDEKLTYLATHDYLTGIPNRMLFEDRFQQALARAERSKEEFAILSIDMDKFKSVNDFYGHPIGDKVLIEVAKRLEKVIRGSDTFARIGGDEFAVIVEEIKNKSDVLRVMQKISNALQTELKIDKNKIVINASMGASIYPIHGNTLDDLFRAADKALYLVKGTESRYKIYSDDQISWLRQ